jgi:hypothetical protein
VVTITVVGKAGALSTVSTQLAQAIENWLGLISGLGITIFGGIFLIATITNTFY